MILAYCRVSTEEQAASGTTSLQEQERKCRALAMMRGAGSFDFVSYVDAGVSGSIPLKERPQGAQMFLDAKTNDIIVAAKLDRIFRSARDALVTVEEFSERGVDLVLIDMGVEPVTANGTAKLFFSMLAAFAEFERGRIAERMTDGRKAKKSNGGHIGGVAPYGFQIVGEGRDARLDPVPAEQETIRLVAQWKTERYQPYHIMKKLNKQGVPTRTGKPWQFVQVERIMERVDG